jgi:hypothetical protein
MAADQRYCLSCGQRRADARLDFLEVLRAAPVAAAIPAAPASRRGTQTTAIVASVGTLLLAMGVGVLIGTAGDDPVASAPAAQPTQVIRVQGGGTAEAASTETATKEKKRPAKEEKDTESAASAADSKATNPALQELDSASPEEYQKQSEKLPKELSTGGKPPPKDDKAPAGGGEFEEIG